ncbi:ABC transporter ATP-binding protein [Brevundimonas albigilva]|nr:ABC transporter ATP-binding protein [Brevundimonas albigilva]UQV17625.1 ABC transporter ATP-binding protein [Brevundimonas albigilva]
MATQWIIRGDALRTPARQAGGWALKGFDFQEQYAAFKVVELLGCVGGLVAVRYEGAQDVDLLYGDGKQVHVQLKNRPSETLNWTALDAVLQGFLSDWLDADQAERPLLSFKLITVSMPEGQDVTRVIRRKHLNLIAKKLADGAKPELKAAHGKTLKEHALKMLSVTQIEFAAPDFQGQLALATRGRLAPFLSEPADAALAISDILATLDAGSVITGRAALDLVRKYALAPGHPFRANSPFKAVGVGMADPSESAVKSFRNGDIVTWEGLDDEIDISRDAGVALKDKILSATHAEFHLVRGPGGSGKTTLARRTAYDIASSGSMLTFDLVDQDPKDKDWDRLFAFAKAMDRRVLLLVDDPKDRTSALDYLLGIDADLPLVILSTTRPDFDVNTMLHEARIPVCDTDLLRITDGEVDRLAAALEKSPPTGRRLTDLQNSGQLFLLAMVMAEGSVDLFATKLLAPLKTAAAPVLSAYLDLCLCARLDQRMPEALLLRRHPQSVRLDENPHLAGLVTRLGVNRDALKAGHAVLAQAVIKVEGVNPASAAAELLEKVRPEREVERRFGIRLVQNIIHLDRGPALASSDVLAEHLLRMAASGEFADLHRITAALKQLGEPAALAKAQTLAAKSPIRTGVDASIKMGEAKGAEKFTALFDELLTFYSRVDTRYGRRNFIARCSNDATPTQAEAMLRVMFPWLSRHGYPALETKSVLDVMATRTDLAVRPFAVQIADLLDHMPSDERALYPAVIAVDARIPDAALRQKLASAANRILSVESLITFPPAGSVYARHLAEHGGDQARQELAQLIFRAASDPRLDGDGQTRKNLLGAALGVVPDLGLEGLRREALKLSVAEPVTAEARMALTHIRAPQPVEIAVSVG